MIVSWGCYYTENNGEAEIHREPFMLTEMVLRKLPNGRFMEVVLHRE